eukprot:m51a1_g4225 hypothetical protein (894) ;mRNA; f:102361-105536
MTVQRRKATWGVQMPAPRSAEELASLVGLEAGCLVLLLARLLGAALGLARSLAELAQAAVQLAVLAAMLVAVLARMLHTVLWVLAQAAVLSRDDAVRAALRLSRCLWETAKAAAPAASTKAAAKASAARTRRRRDGPDVPGTAAGGNAPAVAAPPPGSLSADSPPAVALAALREAAEASALSAALVALERAAHAAPEEMAACGALEAVAGLVTGGGYVDAEVRWRSLATMAAYVASSTAKPDDALVSRALSEVSAACAAMSAVPAAETATSDAEATFQAQSAAARHVGYLSGRLSPPQAASCAAALSRLTASPHPEAAKCAGESLRRLCSEPGPPGMSARSASSLEPLVSVAASSADVCAVIAACCGADLRARARAAALGASQQAALLLLQSPASSPAAKACALDALSSLAPHARQPNFSASREELSAAVCAALADEASEALQVAARRAIRELCAREPEYRLLLARDGAVRALAAMSVARRVHGAQQERSAQCDDAASALANVVRSCAAASKALLRLPGALEELAIAASEARSAAAADCLARAAEAFPPTCDVVANISAQGLYSILAPLLGPESTPEQRAAASACLRVAAPRAPLRADELGPLLAATRADESSAEDALLAAAASPDAAAECVVQVVDGLRSAVTERRTRAALMALASALSPGPRAAGVARALCAEGASVLAARAAKVWPSLRVVAELALARAAEADATARFWLTGAVPASQALPSGFYVVVGTSAFYGPDALRSAPRAPHTAIVVEPETDASLRGWVERARAVAAKTAKGPRALAGDLARLVAELCGGPGADADTAELALRRRPGMGAMVAIGDLRHAGAEAKSVLFKFLADAVGLRASLERSHNRVFVDDATAFVVDVAASPGVLMPDCSAEAKAYVSALDA